MADNCFVITPVGDEDSEIRRETDGLLNAVLKPILIKEFSFACQASHEISQTGSITRQVIKHILEDRLVIANLTHLNPNVMYELAIRHAVKKPVITIAERSTKLPFDVNDQRTIYYVDDMAGAEKLKEELRQAIKTFLSNPAIDNPITQATNETLIEKAISGSTSPDQINKYIIQELRSLREAINQSRPMPPQNAGPYSDPPNTFCVKGEKEKVESLIKSLCQKLPGVTGTRAIQREMDHFHINLLTNGSFDPSRIKGVVEEAGLHFNWYR